MLIRPVAEDLRVISFYLGRIVTVVAMAGLLPTIWAAVGREWRPFSGFLLMVGALLVLGQILLRAGPAAPRLGWGHGMVVVALTWIVVPALGAIPLAVSGHYASFLDAYFDAMSGLSTTGLALIQDLDHLAPSLNFWRHLLQFLGGQGIILAALTLFASGGVLTLFEGEGREERVLPSVGSTARFIWAVAAAHMVAGVLVLAVVGTVILGFTPLRAVFHGLMIFFAGFDTGGFAPQSTSLGYYHSAIFEGVTAVLMVAGAVSFGVHYALWKGRARRVMANLETRTLLRTFSITLFLVLVGLATAGLYGSVAGLSRQGLFQVLSAHTGTGFATVPSSELATWGGLAFGGMALAMALGGMGSSTAGGVKALRVGLTFKTISNQIKQVLLPEGAVVSRGYFQGSPQRLTDEVSQSVMSVTLLYVGLFLVGAGIGQAYGVPLQDALFESVSAGASVGLSVGVTTPTMPVLLKITYILQMWAGRLEFVAVFALFGFLLSWVRGK